MERRLPHYSALRAAADAEGSANLKFSKYHGIGNDFILVDNTHSDSPICSAEEAVRLCDRNFGIGADGLIFAMPGSNGCDYTMRIYNADGSEPEMCGNGIRCMARFLQQHVDTQRRDRFTIWTGAGVIVPVLSADGLSVTVDMGEPILAVAAVPCALPVTFAARAAAVNAPMQVMGREYRTTAVSMGNPHSVSSHPLTAMQYETIRHCYLLTLSCLNYSVLL